MKKLISVFLAVLIFSFMYVSVFADVEGPILRSIDYIVSNPDGAKFYTSYYNEKTDKFEIKTQTIPYGTKFTARAEYEMPYELKDNAEFEGMKFISVSYNDEYGYVSFDDVTSNEDSFPLEKAYKLPEPRKFHITNEDGLKVYSGPSISYKEVGLVPDGADIEVLYVENTTNNSEDENAGNAFGYIEYGDIKGWVYDYTYSGFDLAHIVTGTSYLAGKAEVIADDVKLLDLSKPIEDENSHDVFETVGDVIPAGTQLTFKYYYDSPHVTYALTEYNGTEGAIAVNKDFENSTVATYINDYIMVYDDTDLYTESGNTDSEADKELPADTMVKAKAYYIANAYTDDDDDYTMYYDHWFLVEYDNEDYWICFDQDDYDDYERAFGLCCRVGLNDGHTELPVFSSYALSGEPIGTITDASKVYSVFDKYYGEENNLFSCYIFDLNSHIQGWVDGEIINIDYQFETDVDKVIKEFNGENTEEEPEETSSPEESADIAEAEDISEKAAEKAVKSINRNLIICIAAAVILAITALIIILLIRKKKNSKTEE